ncbi:MAG TPA: AtpZ/AtpI family protein [Dokdonella sp.]
MASPEPEPDRVLDAARRAAARAEAGRRDPEPSLARRLGQIGVLGWTIVVPVLLGLFAGRALDRLFGSGLLFAAALLFAGAAFGLWSAWRWMQRQ